MTRFLRVWLMVFAGSLLAAPGYAAVRCDAPFSDVFRQVSPSVVAILSVVIDPFSLADRVRLGIGSGFVVDEDGNIVTNAHVVHEATEVMISLEDGDMRPAEIVGVDPLSDVALIRAAEPVSGLRKARLGRSGELRVAEEVLAIGYPFGLGKTATRGIVSGLDRVLQLTPMSWLTPYIQVDAAVSPGNSGGPLVNRCGEVLGINTIAGGAGQNINFAVPIDLVREIVPRLREDGRVIRPWHGIHGRLVPPLLSMLLGVVPGFMVETVEPGSPAEEVGLRGGTLPVVIGVEQYLLGGDVITAVGGRPLSDMDTVIAIAEGLQVGDTVTFEYWREGSTRSAEVTLPERPVLPGDWRRFERQGPIRRTR